MSVVHGFNREDERSMHGMDNVRKVNKCWDLHT